MSNVMECPRCGDVTLAEINCTADEHIADLYCTEFECEECGHFECHWGRS